MLQCLGIYILFWWEDDIVPMHEDKLFEARMISKLAKRGEYTSQQTDVEHPPHPLSNKVDVLRETESDAFEVRVGLRRDRSDDAPDDLPMQCLRLHLQRK